MADKMREIFGDDSDSEQENDSKSQDEEVENEEEVEEEEHEEEPEEEEEHEEVDHTNEEHDEVDHTNEEHDEVDHTNEEHDEVDHTNEEHEEVEENGSDVQEQEESGNEIGDDDNEEHNESQQEVEEQNEDEENQNNNNSSIVEDNENSQQHKQGSEAEDEENSKQGTQAVEAVFGDELADLSEDSDIDTDNLSRSQNKTHVTDEPEEEQEAEHLINMEIPRIKTNFGKEMHFVKLPNFLSVEPKPFDPDYYEDETVNSDALDEEGKTRIKLKVENTMRWKYGKDEAGNEIKESNARIVRWSDGSLSLHLGNEIFDIYKQYMQGDHNHLFVRQGSALQGLAVFRTKLAFRPHSTDSLTHRKMTMSLVDSGAKTQKVKILSEAKKNPDAQRAEMIKKEEEKLRAASRRENQQRRLREKSHSKGLSTAYLEDKYSEDDESAISLNSIKSKFKPGHKSDSRNSINSSGDESDRERRLNKAKSYNDDSDNERNQMKKKKKIVADDDE